MESEGAVKQEKYKEVMWDEDSNVCSVHEEDLEVTDQLAEEAEEEKEERIERLGNEATLARLYERVQRSSYGDEPFQG